MNQLLDSLTFEPSGGCLSLQSARYFIVRPTLLVDLQKSIEALLGHEAGQIMAQTAAIEGASLAGRYRDAFGYSSEQVIGSVAFMLSELGWGAVSVEMTNLEGREMVFKVMESPFAEPYGPSTQPVCHLLLGTFQGIAMTIFESEATGMEVQCLAKGDSCCRFVVSA
ncbi:MAG TPA: 4-vinyl reductase [Vicinamibacteria bacterium]|nr:4-vinyl reductase [Vicinamibacteria bacterium]